MRATLFCLWSLVISACDTPPRHVPPVANPRQVMAPAPAGEASQPHAVPLSPRAQGYLATLCAPEPAMPPEPVVEPSEAEDWTLNYVLKARSSDTCELAQDNLTKAEEEILATAPPTRIAHWMPWNHHSAPRFQNLVEARWGISRTAKSWLERNGFAVLADGPLDSYATAYHDIHQRELPVFVTRDSIFHALFASTDTILSVLEKSRLAPELHRTLIALQCGLPAARGYYPEDAARDLDLYVAVARKLLSPYQEVQTVLTESTKLAELSELAERAEGLVELELFGRKRMVDFSQYAPRGHYATNGMSYLAAPAQGSLEHYFRAAMWLSRLELNVVSRSSRSSHPDLVPDPRETPREAVLALAIADLVQRTGQLDRVEQLERAFALMGGRREDLSVRDLLTLRSKAGISDLRAPDTAERLKRAIGDGFRRTARLHFMPQNSPELPVISTLFGPRVPNDVAALRDLVHDEIPGRYMVGAGDIAVLLGHPLGEKLLGTDVEEFPDLIPRLELGRKRIRQGQVGDTQPSAALYDAWMKAVLAIGQPPSGVNPSFTSTEPYEYLKMNSALVAFGQVRHNFVLSVGQGYDAYGCAIPDGYVEPALETYRALVEYVRASRAAFGQLDPADATGGKKYFDRVSRVLAVLVRITEHQSTGAELTDAQRRWLAMVAEYIPEGSFDSGGPPRYTGWYFDLFFARDKDSKSTGAFIADYYTSTNLGKVAYLGASRPRLGLFVVDAGGAPRLMVGPVARGYEHVGELEARLDDDQAELQGVGASSWEGYYTVPEAPAPELSVAIERVFEKRATPNQRYSGYSGPSHWNSLRVEAVRLKLESPRELGQATVEVVGHHGESLASQAIRIGRGPTLLTLRLPENARREKPVPEGIRLRLGDFVYTQGASAYRPLDHISLPVQPRLPTPQ